MPPKDCAARPYEGEAAGTDTTTRARGTCLPHLPHLEGELMSNTERNYDLDQYLLVTLTITYEVNISDVESAYGETFEGAIDLIYDDIPNNLIESALYNNAPMARDIGCTVKEIEVINTEIADA